ncbi:unnamed protein product [Arctogadus glacialis]
MVRRGRPGGEIEMETAVPHQYVRENSSALRSILSLHHARDFGLMSLNDFLRDGGEAPYRIMNRLSQLIQNLDITGLAPTFSFSPSSRRNSWREWEAVPAAEGVRWRE